MFPIGLCEPKFTNVHPILTIMFKNILGTFEAEIINIFKDMNSASAQKFRYSYKKK